MSRLVHNSPTSGDTTTSPASASRRETVAYTTKSSSYFTVPRPFSSTATRSPAPMGRSARTRSTSRAARSEAGGIGTSEMPGSPWMPRPSDMNPSGTVNSGASAPGRVHPAKATPKLRVRSFAWRPTRTVSARS